MGILKKNMALMHSLYYPKLTARSGQLNDLVKGFQIIIQIGSGCEEFVQSGTMSTVLLIPP